LEITLIYAITLIQIQRVIMLAEGDNVYVTMWETVKGKQQVMRVSNDNGATFGLYSRYPLMNVWWRRIARKE
jgi:hypothetical protein